VERFDRSVSLICWAYNEEESIRDFLKKAYDLMHSTVEDFEIVLIDDGSTDKTYEIAHEFQKNKNNLKIYRNGKNMNVGYSCKRAIQLASKEYLFWQTIDWSYDISDLRTHLEHLKQYDIVQGVRWAPVLIKTSILRPIIQPIIQLLKLFGIKHLTRRSDNLQKAIVSVINFIVIRSLFRVRLGDFQNVTFYPTHWIQSINHESNTSFVSPEALIKSYWNGFTIKEVPINFIARQQGTAKGTKLTFIISAIKDILRLWIRWMIFKNNSFKKAGKIYRLK